MCFSWLRNSATLLIWEPWDGRKQLVVISPGHRQLAPTVWLECLVQMSWGYIRESIQFILGAEDDLIVWSQRSSSVWGKLLHIIIIIVYLERSLETHPNADILEKSSGHSELESFCSKWVTLVCFFSQG